MSNQATQTRCQFHPRRRATHIAAQSTNQGRSVTWVPICASDVEGWNNGGDWDAPVFELGIRMPSALLFRDGGTKGTRASPKFMRESEFHQIAYMFSRRDSRGGDTLVIGGTTVQAMQRYNATMGLPDDDKSAFSDLLDGSGGPVELIVCDIPLVGPELSQVYGGKFEAGWLKCRIMRSTTSLWDIVALVLWDARITIPRTMEKSTNNCHWILQPLDVGEDAFGLRLI